MSFLSDAKKAKGNAQMPRAPRHPGEQPLEPRTTANGKHHWKVEEDQLHVSKLADTIQDVKMRFADAIADAGKAPRVVHRPWTIEEFAVNGWSVTTTPFSDVNATTKSLGQEGAKGKVAKDFDTRVTKGV